MDCCKTKKENKCCKDLEKMDELKSLKGGFNKMQIRKKTLMWIVIGVLFLAVLFLTFKVSGNTSAAQATGQVTRTAASAGAGMVGGC